MPHFLKQNEAFYELVETLWFPQTRCDALPRTFHCTLPVPFDLFLSFTIPRSVHGKWARGKQLQRKKI